MRRFPAWIVLAVLVVSSVNVWAIRRRESGSGETASQVARRDDVTRLITDGETAASGAVEPVRLWWSDLQFERITWREWSDERAVGRATLVANTCEPSCADANIESYPVHLMVAGPTTVCGGRFFSTLSWTPAGPAGRTGTLGDILPYFLRQPTKGAPCR